MTENILWFKDLHNSDIPKVGGKAANLGEMTNANFPIPPGFVVTADAFRRFLVYAKLKDDIYPLLNKLNTNDNTTLQETAKQIQKLIISKEVPEDIRRDILEAYENLSIDKIMFEQAGRQAYDIIKAGRDLPLVAVRSSATAEDLPEASFAGQQATYLNIKGNDSLVQAVKECWASLFTARAIFYRVQNNFPHDKVLIAVVVQKMIQSKSAGVIFTINPTNNHENEILIEAAYGLGEAVVSGSLTPDNYIVDKKTLEIIRKKTTKQTWYFELDINLKKTIKKMVSEDKQNLQKISDSEIIKLAQIARNIEKHYQKPQDIEFAVDNNNLYIVQSRPITTIKKIAEKMVKKSEEQKTSINQSKEILIGLPASPGIATGVAKLVKDANDLGKIEKGNLLVTEMTNPDYVAAMERAGAVITDSGGLTSHAAIISREMGTPCIVGTNNATELLKEGQTYTIDGTTGKIYEGKIEIDKPIELGQQEIGVPAIETVTDIKVIMDLPKYAEKAAKTGADGVGLLRAEHMILGSKYHPAYLIKTNRKNELVNQLAEGILTIAKAFKGKPVWYRTLDAPTDEFRSLEGGEDEPKEENPMLGWRGIRRDLDQIELLKAQFEAIKKVHDQGLTNVGVMLPLITHIEQVKKGKSILEEVGLIPMENIEFGVMVETPAAVQIIKEICEEGIDFISFGTNDLTQFTLAIDRNNSKIQYLYNELHPAVLRQIEKVIKTCREYNVETSICGQAGSNPKMAEFLVKVGIDSISANPDAVGKIRQTVAKAERKLLLKIAREKK